MRRIATNNRTISAESKEEKDSHTRRNQAGKGKERHQASKTDPQTSDPIALPASRCSRLHFNSYSSSTDTTRGRSPQILPGKLGAGNLRPTDSWVVLGYSFKLVTTPHQAGDSLPKPILFAADLSRLVSASIHDLEHESAIQEVSPHPDQFISQVFLVPKKDGSQ